MNIKKLGCRFALLGAAFRHLFTGKALTLQGGFTVTISGTGMCAEMNVQRGDSQSWEHVAVTFDYVHPPVGYVDGRVLISHAPISIQAGGNVTIDGVRLRK
jgi:hypothetical protein